MAASLKGRWATLFQGGQDRVTGNIRAPPKLISRILAPENGLGFATGKRVSIPGPNGRYVESTRMAMKLVEKGKLAM